MVRATCVRVTSCEAYEKKEPGRGLVESDVAIIMEGSEGDRSASRDRLPGGEDDSDNDSVGSVKDLGAASEGANGGANTRKSVPMPCWA